MIRLSLILYLLVKTGSITPQEADKLQHSKIKKLIIPDHWREVEEQINEFKS